MARTLWHNSQRMPAKMAECARLEALGYVLLAARIEAEATAARGGSYEQCLQRMIEVLRTEADKTATKKDDDGKQRH